MGIPVIEAFEVNTAVAGTTIDADIPATTAVGDLILIVATSDNNSLTTQWPPISSPDAYTRIINYASSTADVSLGVYWRIADGTETTPVTITPTTSGDDLVCFCLRISGADTSSTIDVTGTVSTYGSAASHIADTINTTVADCLALAFFGSNGFDTAPVDSISGTGWSIYQEQAIGSIGQGHNAAIAEKDQASIGATGDVTFNITPSDTAHAVQIAISGASGGIIAQASNHLNNLNNQ